MPKSNTATTRTPMIQYLAWRLRKAGSMKKMMLAIDPKPANANIIFTCGGRLKNFDKTRFISRPPGPIDFVGPSQSRQLHRGAVIGCF